MPTGNPLPKVRGKIMRLSHSSALLVVATVHLTLQKQLQGLFVIDFSRVDFHWLICFDHSVFSQISEQVLADKPGLAIRRFLQLLKRSHQSPPTKVFHSA